MIKELAWYYIGFTTLLTMAFSAYGLAVKPHIVKKMALFTILSDAIYVLLIYLGYRPSASAPPVYPGGSLENPVLPSSSETSAFATLSVDPVPQVLIVTAIVIGLAIFILMAVIAVKIASETGTLNLLRIERGEER
ncbi:MAG: sodium:proton antiporter [Zestosphaera sp.]